MFNTIEEAIADIQAGKMVVVVDDEDRENEGDLLMAASEVTPEAINFMATYGRGLICMPMEEMRLSQLGLNMMVEQNTDTYQTAFTVSVDSNACTTGISAFERALTIKQLMDPTSTPNDFKRPGHIFPLRSVRGGVLKRAGHTESAVDLAKLAGLQPAGVICEIMNDDGTMARRDDLVTFCEKHQLKLIKIVDLIAYRRKNENLVSRAASAKLPTRYGEFEMIGFENLITKEHHVALVKGDVYNGDPVLIRVHSECLTGDAFGSLRCDCGQQYDAAMKKIAEEGRGILLYMRQEGRGIGLINKIKAYHLQDQGLDTVEANLALGFGADMRDYGIGAQILSDLGVKKLILMTNNPRKMVGLAGYGIEIVDRVPIQLNHNESNENYLKTKKSKLGHMLQFETEEK
ncbi:MAG: bifunctional 3,4-dihydroxy-2-butanone-4-phosphate synthase/GTP cyclohydrolase II [Erysipelothrix sp.]|nr:bifunctional 3,4-dihydroxy-2-butanone-4-phosphate synthase/GTP cyclohydrolase II [Erysipelothrix sp.]